MKEAQQGLQSSQELSVGLFSLTIEQLGEVMDLGIPLEGIFIIECLMEGTNPQVHLKTAKVGGIMQLLKRKGYLTEKGEVSFLGKELYYELLNGRGSTPKIKTLERELKKVTDSHFDEWWAAFPAHDGFEDTSKGYETIFPKTRVLRLNKESSRALFEKIVMGDNIDPRTIIEATEAHIKAIKKESMKKKENKLTYLQNSLTYLRNRTYEAFIEDIGKQDDEPIGRGFNL